VRLATDPAFADVTGGYFAVEDTQPLECPEFGRGEMIQHRLWEATANFLHDIQQQHTV
jgi:hypothetical protein